MSLAKWKLTSQKLRKLGELTSNIRKRIKAKVEADVAVEAQVQPAPSGSCGTR